MKTYDELLTERDALAAQAEVLKKEFKDARETIQTIASCGLDSTDTEIADVALSESRRWVSRYDESVLKKTPQQCLAEIKAEAGRAGFIAGYHKMHIEFVGSLASSEGAEFAASQYVAKIRNAGTWLKDSNVNGGKRQGGEK